MSAVNGVGGGGQSEDVASGSGISRLTFGAMLMATVLALILMRVSRRK